MGSFSGMEFSHRVPEKYEGLLQLDGNQWAKESLIKCNGISMLNCKTDKSYRDITLPSFPSLGDRRQIKNFIPSPWPGLST